MSTPHLILSTLMQLISKWVAKMGNGRMAKWHDVTNSIAFVTHLLSSVVVCNDITPFAICLLDHHSEIGCTQSATYSYICATTEASPTFCRVCNKYVTHTSSVLCHLKCNSSPFLKTKLYWEDIGHAVLVMV